ncbi:anhydro-N-acetylmuramic acid kinase [Sinomicrobium weinanense]|uniref:Anhydro-N-acetylmuramic acid kinase n=1 Tax=Sinomicrobium weinanense TaxID=2842200 RepID=A0A926Q3C3_9FLAO|nr:anhydro-N-acetylmuramic acid kinase [Sinomicrobium weinanense]MBC9797467.1 anhydro-N-acetylmuramic acid kinase [Sinomicrobium weinanense]MBU3124459.1 anhydro-N-acetylmuramic acid kinase [Sinomicrobium weinanense]
MKRSVEKLYEISRKASRNIIGLMSGTSLDGLDIALCRITGSGLETRAELLAFTTIPYEPGFCGHVREVFARKDGELEKICLLHPLVAQVQARMVVDALKQWKISPEEVDLIASHGQTVYHAPYSFHHNPEFPNATLQLGDGDHMAEITGIITLSDFRQKHIAAGGEGAPLAIYGDYLLFADKEESRLLLNMGGISNLTFIPAATGFDRVFCTDVGPGNTLMDAYVQKYFNLPYDEDARIASRGQLNEDLLNRLMDHSFLRLSAPKTTGPELFNMEYLDAALETSGMQGQLSHEDILHTLAHFTVKCIAQCIAKHLPADSSVRGFVSGGGASNPLVLNLLKKTCPDLQFTDTSALGLDPDAKEAVLFALLANETVSGSANVEGTAAYPWVSMGKVSFPG